MAVNTFTFVSFENLQQYDSLLKPYIDGKISDAVKSSIKAISFDKETKTIKFYNVNEPVGSTAPIYTIELPETDLSDLIHKIKNATAGNVVIANADGTVADGGVQLGALAKSEDVTTEINKTKDALATEIKKNTDAITTLNGADTVDGSVAKAVKDARDTLQDNINANKKEVDGKIGNLNNLLTDTKTDIVSAINDVKSEVDAATVGDKITVETQKTTTGMLKSYTIKQGGKDVATIDIPKDMVVKSGVVETNPAGQAAGTYLVLTLANTEEDKVYINVGTLVDIYTAEESAAQVQLTINPTTRVISASIVAGSITSVELADGAITTVKIADGNVTKTKLATDVQTTLGKADTALQESDITDLRDTVETLTGKVDTLESVKYVSATQEDIKSMFPDE